MALVWQILSLAALASGSYAGLRTPDVDQSTWFLLHRSAITHGPLLPLAAFAPALGSNAPVRRRFGMGVCIGFAIHTAFDVVFSVVFSSVPDQDGSSSGVSEPPERLPEYPAGRLQAVQRLVQDGGPCRSGIPTSPDT